MEALQPMVYSSERETSVLHSGTFMGIKFEILSLGTHPTAYFGIPVTHPLANRDYDTIPIDVHGGLTYGRIREEDPDTFWYGWDYAHAGDYCGYLSSMIFSGDTKYTTEQILTHVYSAIEQFSKLTPDDVPLPEEDNNEDS